jgi:DNA polymerase
MTLPFDTNLIDDAIQTAITGDQLIYVADSSNIEARMLAWLAGQSNLIEIFASGGDVYSNFASILFGRPIHKDNDPLERFIGKVCVLGLGYGMGWKKFRDTLAAGALGGPPVYFTEVEAQNAVETYRSANACIKAYWQAADAAIADMYLGNTRQWGPLTIHRNCLVMPNGMALQYPGLRPAVKEDKRGNEFTDGWEYWNGKFWTKIYGGKLVENITQALSRIVLFEQMLRINQDVLLPVGGRVVLNVHDEIIGVGPSFGARFLGKEKNAKGKLVEVWDNTAGADALFQQIVDTMRTPEPWCLDLPLDSEGGYAFEYSK